MIALITTILDRAAKLPGRDCLFTGVMSFANLGAADLVGANLIEATLTGATLDGAIWNNTTCPDGSQNDGNSPCTTEQLNMA